MACFDQFNKREKIISRTVEIEDVFYEILEKLSRETYDASINKLVNAAVASLVENENIQTYNRKNGIRLPRTFLFRESLLERLYDLKNKYSVPLYLLVNIAIRNALIEEGLIEDDKNSLL